MARYLIRIELHGPAADHARLNEIMATLGAERTILGSNDQPWHLPTGEYVTHTDPGAAAAIRDLIRPALPPAGSDPEAWVLVIEVVDAAWFTKAAE